MARNVLLAQCPVRAGRPQRQHHQSSRIFSLSPVPTPGQACSVGEMTPLPCFGQKGARGEKSGRASREPRSPACPLLNAGILGPHWVDGRNLPGSLQGGRPPLAVPTVPTDRETFAWEHVSKWLSVQSPRFIDKHVFPDAGSSS